MGDPKAPFTPVGPIGDTTDVPDDSPWATVEAERTLAETLDAVRAHLVRFIHFARPEHATAVALWVAHTHADLELLEQSPILALTSAVKQSGKSRLLDLLHHLVRDPWRISRPTEAVLFRKIDRDHPTILLDEIDTVFGDKTGSTEGVRSLLDSGNRQGTRVPRAVPQGRTFGLVEFDVFCPKATAGIGGLPDTVLDRAIVIPMERRSRNERVERLRERTARELGAPLRDALAERVGAIDCFIVADLTLPSELDERTQDGWEPLLAIADAAGDHWPASARAAAVAIFANRSGADDNLALRLLADCRAVFEAGDEPLLPSTDLRNALLELEASPWADIRGREITPHYLAKLLRGFGITSQRSRLSGGKNPIAFFTRSSFEDAWDRYLPSTEIDTTGTIGTSGPEPELAPALSVPDVSDVPVAARNAPDSNTELMDAALRLFGDDIEAFYVQGTA